MAERRPQIHALGRRYYLVCSDGQGAHWWDRFFKPGFRHCYVLIWEGCCWLYVDPTLYRTFIAILDHYDDRHPRDWIKDPYASVIEVKVGIAERMRAPWCVGPLTCVEGAKALLGIRSFFLWSPWRLYRYVEKHHGIQPAPEDEAGEGAGGCADARARPDAGRDQRASAPGAALTDWGSGFLAEWE